MGVMAEIRGALAGGATKEQLEASGYKRSSIYQGQKQLKKPGDGCRQTAQRRAKGSAPNQVPVVRPVTPVPRLTQQQIVLPGAMFILYDHVRAMNPEYIATQSEWLQDVVQCWAEATPESCSIHDVDPKSLPALVVPARMGVFCPG